MTIPKVTRQTPPNAPNAPDSAASAFWQAADFIDKTANTRAFTGDLTPFGFVATRDDAHLDTIHKALSAAQDLTPDLGVVPKGSVADEMTYFKGEAACHFWCHADALTFAVTVPYRFARPYGDAHATLFTMAPAGSEAKQTGRIAKLASLEAAHQSRRAHPQIAHIDAYQSRTGMGGAAFAFAKYLSSTGRDQSIQTAAGFCAGQTGDAPALFVQLDLSELCQ